MTEEYMKEGYKLDRIGELVEVMFGECGFCIIVGLPDGMVHYSHNLPADTMASLLRGTADMEDARQTEAGDEKDDLNGVGHPDKIG